MTTLEARLAEFDALDPVEPEFMLGAWVGHTLPSGHPIDGVLETCGWHGKRFESAEHVHPLVFRGPHGRRLQVDPRRVAWALPWLMRFPALKSPGTGRLVRASLPLLATRRSRARLRMTRYRGKLTATLVYDQVPILDVFARMSPDMAMGVMDLKGMAQAFFFVLQREGASCP